LQRKDRRSPTADLTYNTLPVLQLHDLQILLFVHKCLHHRITSPIFSNYFSMNNVVHDYKIRQSNLLHLQAGTSTQYGKRCILNNCTLWDNLPKHLSIHQFKTLLKDICRNVIM